jgi:orotidine-5'-phosphate decarboxylase
LFITVHGQNIAILRNAVKNCGDSKILAITVLTSIGEEECSLNLGGPVKAKVLQFARNAVLAGAHGIVCSARELIFLSNYPETHGLIKVTPAIRPEWYHDPKDDQARPTTIETAVLAGADYLVIGRPIITAPRPKIALLRSMAEVEEAINKKTASNLA